MSVASRVGSVGSALGTTRPYRVSLFARRQRIDRQCRNFKNLAVPVGANALHRRGQRGVGGVRGAEQGHFSDTACLFRADVPGWPSRTGAA